MLAKVADGEVMPGNAVAECWRAGGIPRGKSMHPS